MGKTNEELNFKTLKNRDIDPYGEEDWDEYEISSGDILYYFFYKDGEMDAGICKAALKNDRFTITTIKSIYGKIQPGTTLDMPGEIRTDVDNNQFSSRSYNVGNGKLVAIVNDFKYSDKFKDVHESIRNFLYGNVKSIKKSIQNENTKMDTLEGGVIKLKKDLKSADEFPESSQLKLGEREYVVIKSKKTGDKPPHRISVDLLLCEISDKADEKNGYHLINKESGEKIIYIQNTFNKLKANGYLLLKTKRNPDDKTYITRDIELYDKFVERVVSSTNEDISNSISSMRKEYRTRMETVKKKNVELEEAEQGYLEFNFSTLADKLKKLIKDND